MSIHRLRLLLLVTIPVFTLWTSFMLTVGRVVPPLEVAANILIGLLAGALAVFLTDHDAPRFYLRDGILNVACFAALTTLYAAFALRGDMTFATVDPLTDEVFVYWGGLLGYLVSFAWRGAVIGLLLWLLGGVNVGYTLGGQVGRLTLTSVTLIGLFAAPLAANAIFDEALFVVVMVGTRLMMGLLVPSIPDWWQGFIFGTLAGVTMVLLPFIAYASGGAL